MLPRPGRVTFQGKHLMSSHSTSKAKCPLTLQEQNHQFSEETKITLNISTAYKKGLCFSISLAHVPFPANCKFANIALAVFKNHSQNYPSRRQHRNTHTGHQAFVNAPMALPQKSADNLASLSGGAFWNLLGRKYP